MKFILKVIKWAIAGFFALFVLAAISGGRSSSSGSSPSNSNPTSPAPATAAAATSASAPTPDPMRSTPTEKDFADAREWARSVARTRTNDAIWAKMYPEKARINRMKHGAGLTVEQYAEFEAGNEKMFDTSQYRPLYPKNVSMQKWFVEYTVPIIKNLMGNAAVIFMHYGQDASTQYFYDLKDHPEKLAEIAKDVHDNIKAYQEIEEEDKLEARNATTAKKPVEIRKAIAVKKSVVK